MLSGASTLTPQDIETLAYGLCPAWPERAQELLSEAVRRLQGQTVPSNRHLVLVLDKVRSWGLEGPYLVGSGHQVTPLPPSDACGCLAGDGNPCMLFVQDLQKLPWESIPSLRALPVTRLPSFHFLLSYSIIREVGFREWGND